MVKEVVNELELPKEVRLGYQVSILYVDITRIIMPTAIIGLMLCFVIPEFSFFIMGVIFLLVILFPIFPVLLVVLFYPLAAIYYLLYPITLLLGLLTIFRRGVVTIVGLLCSIIGSILYFIQLN